MNLIIMNEIEKPFDRIVLPIDGSDPSKNAIRKSLELAKNLKLPIHAIYVIDMSMYSNILTSDQVSEQWRSILENEGLSLLNNFKESAKKENVPTETEMLEGVPSEEIIETSKKNDLIIMGRKGKSSLDRIFIGSVSENVLHHSDSTVLLIH